MLLVMYLHDLVADDGLQGIVVIWKVGQAVFRPRAETAPLTARNITLYYCFQTDTYEKTTALRLSERIVCDSIT